jgi:hypothetical protein
MIQDRAVNWIWSNSVVQGRVQASFQRHAGFVHRSRYRARQPCFVGIASDLTPLSQKLVSKGDAPVP